MGRPVAVMGPSAYDTLGCARRLKSESSIREVLDFHPAPDVKTALPYGLMMQRRGFSFAHLKPGPNGLPSLHGIELAEANELTRKISDALRRRQMTRLT